MQNNVYFLLMYDLCSESIKTSIRMINIKFIMMAIFGGVERKEIEGIIQGALI